MRLPSRGFYCELEPPLPVEVARGARQGDAAEADRRLPAQAGRHVRVRARRRVDSPTRREEQGGRRFAMTMHHDDGDRWRMCSRRRSRCVAVALRAGALGPRAGAAPQAPAATRRAPADARARTRPRRRGDNLEPRARRRDNGGRDAGTVKIKLVADSAPTGARLLGTQGSGVAPLEIRAPARQRAARSDRLAPGCLPLHTRVFTDRDDTLSLRLYAEREAAGACPAIPTESRAPI